MKGMELQKSLLKEETGLGQSYVRTRDTHVGIGPISPNAMVTLKSNEFQIGMIPPGITIPVSFLLKVPASGFTGSLHQEITLDLIC
jgi:hypothetical protein